ncbi:unnamed protein product [Lactuca virosa]|uniref:Uncharacterized protein n=1 Tax=Lactuca virosa TaxID=75947 RepID=A0AAU9M8L3_9ASTR|nr:unnamed protein product [Lactuca virosa]
MDAMWLRRWKMPSVCDPGIKCKCDCNFPNSTCHITQLSVLRSCFLRVYSWIYDTGPFGLSSHLIFLLKPFSCFLMPLPLLKTLVSAGAI